MKIIAIYGCGGLGREIADLVSRLNKWERIVFVDDSVKSKVVDGIEVYSFDEVIKAYGEQDCEFIVATGEPSSRQVLCQKLTEYRLTLATIAYPGFFLSKSSSLGTGTIIHIGAVLTCNVHIGYGCLINKHVVIGHDVTVGDYCVLSPNATIGGNVYIGNSCYVGSGAVIRNGITIGENSIIGMGAVVLKNVEPRSVMVGNPARLSRKNLDNRVFR